MANEDETKSGEPEAPEMYVVHNVSREIETKTQRFTEPNTGRRRQLFLPGGERLLKGRPKSVSATWLAENKDQVMDLIKQGRLEVRTSTGELMDLETGKVAESKVAPATPNPPLDSAANDVPAGERMPQMMGGMALSDFSSTGGGTSSKENVPGPKPTVVKTTKGKWGKSEPPPEGDVHEEDVPFDEKKERK